METVSEDMVDSGTASESPAEQKQHATLAAESLSHITTGYEQEYSFDTMCSQAATHGSNMISNGNHSCLTDSEQKTPDFSTGSTDSYITKQYTVTDHCCEPVSNIQEIREFTDMQSTFVSEGHDDTTSMEVEQVCNQEAERGLHQEAEQILHQEAERGLHQEAERGLYQEAERGLYQEAERGLHQEAEQILHQKVELGLNEGAERPEVHDTVTAAGISETKPKFECIPFIGLVMPSSHQLQSHGVCADVSEDDTDEVIMEPPCDPQTPNVSSADDFRYNLTLGSVPRLAASTSWEFQRVDENFLRGCKWSPDGSCVLTNSNDNCLRIFNSCNETGTSKLTENKQLMAAVRMKECSLVYDFAWHPKMNLSQSENCRVACTCSGIPIHLWDTTTGQIVANYRAYDQFDEITAAYSLSFSLDGRKIYAGYNKAMRIFDTDYPVRSCKTVKTYNSQRKDGQTGIISSFAFSPDGNGLYVAGSYSRHIGMYDSACDKLVCLMQGQHGGVTHLMFSPDATKLYSGGRKDAEILCWDMRNMDKLLFSALRDVKTNQRMYFDLSGSGRYLVSGNNDGTVAFWDTLGPIEEINGDAFLKPCSQFQAHGDCVNGVSFNRHKNMLATASGQRHFQNFDYDSSDSAEDEEMRQADTLDFSLRLWQIPLLS